MTLKKTEAKVVFVLIFIFVLQFMFVQIVNIEKEGKLNDFEEMEAKLVVVFVLIFLFAQKVNIEQEEV